jgi:predicted metalloenzyme YecM
MRRGSTDNISIILIGLNDPLKARYPKKGNEHIKIMGSILSSRNK